MDGMKMSFDALLEYYTKKNLCEICGKYGWQPIPVNARPRPLHTPQFSINS
jgi:hypothetical protein